MCAQTERVRVLIAGGAPVGLNMALTPARHAVAAMLLSVDDDAPEDGQHQPPHVGWRGDSAPLRADSVIDRVRGAPFRWPQATAGEADIPARPSQLQPDPAARRTTN
jgi:hypothetical protein